MRKELYLDLEAHLNFNNDQSVAWFVGESGSKAESSSAVVESDE